MMLILTINYFLDEPHLQTTPLTPDESHRMMQCEDITAIRDISNRSGTNKNYYVEEEEEEEFNDEMKNGRLTERAVSKKNTDEEFERIEAYCNFSKYIGSSDRSYYQGIGRANERNVQNQELSPSQHQQFLLAEGQQSRNASTQPNRALTSYPLTSMRYHNHPGTEIYSDAESDLENNLDIDSPDETDSDNDYCYAGHSADSNLRRYSDSASASIDKAESRAGDRRGINIERGGGSNRGRCSDENIGRDGDRSAVTLRLREVVPGIHLNTSRSSKYTNDGDHVLSTDLIYSNNNDSTGGGGNRNGDRVDRLVPGSPGKHSLHLHPCLPSSHYAMEENPYYNCSNKGNTGGGGHEVRDSNLSGVNLGILGGLESTLGSDGRAGRGGGSRPTPQRHDSVPGISRDERSPSNSAAQESARTATTAVSPGALSSREKEKGGDREEELCRLMGIKYHPTSSAPAPPTSTLLSRSQLQQQTHSSPYPNPRCGMNANTNLNAHLDRSTDPSRREDLQLDFTRAASRHMRSSLRDPAAEADRKGESSFEANSKDEKEKKKKRTGEKENTVHSLPRIKLLCGWLSSLHLWDRDIEVSTLHTELRSGLFLLRLLRTFDPSADFPSMNMRVHSARPALENLEQVLGHILRTKRVDKKK